LAVIAVKQHSNNIEHLSDKLKDDKEIALIAVDDFGGNIKYLNNLKNDYDVASKAIERNGGNMRYLGDELKNNKELGLKAVENHGSNIR